ncbi:MAG: tol-pal system protein YbgF [Desulfomicrobium sp.]
MRMTLAFVAGMLAGALLAWAGGPALTRLACEWPALVRTEALSRIRSAVAPQPDSPAPGLSPRETHPISSRLRRPVVRVLRMAGRGPVMTVALNATTPVAAATVQPSADAPTIVRAPAGPTGTETPAGSQPKAGPDASPAVGKAAVDGAPGTDSPGADAPRVQRGKKSSPGTPRDEYARALVSYQAGRYALARERFAAFMTAFPGHALAPNALYWSGETWYAQGDYDRAAEFFAQVVRDFPRHAKSPDALLKLAYSSLRQGRLEQAGKYLRRLEASYPDSPASRLGRQARSRLQGDNGSARVVLAHG